MVHTIRNDVLTAAVSEDGAQLTSITGADGCGYLWDGDPAYWKEQAPVLFPFVARLAGEKYLLDGKEYPLTIHGFAKESIFQVIEQDEAHIVLELTDSEKTFAVYPFRFAFRAGYALEGERLDITYQVVNRSENTMVFGIGGHPGFRVPLEEGLAFTDYYLEFAQACRPDRVGFTPDCYVNGKNTLYPLEEGRIIRLKHELFDDDAIVLQHMADTITLKSDRGRRFVTVRYPQMPYLGLWHKPHSDAPYVAIEPWVSLPGRAGVTEDFRTRTDLIRLRPGAVYENRWSVTCSAVDRKD